MVRDSEEAEWRHLLSWDREDAITSRALGFSADGASIYLLDSRGAATGRLVALDLESGATEVLAEDPDYDLDDVFGVDLMLHHGIHAPPVAEPGAAVRHHDHGKLLAIEAGGKAQVAVDLEAVAGREAKRLHRGQGVALELRYVLEEERALLRRAIVGVVGTGCRVLVVVDEPGGVVLATAGDVEVAGMDSCQVVEILLQGGIQSLPRS